MIRESQRGMDHAPPITLFETEFQCCSVEFSPYDETVLAVSTAQYFGIIGNGRQYVLQVAPDGAIREVRNFLTQEGLYDCSWSEAVNGQLVSASADGSVKLWDISTTDDFPIAQWSEHREEVSSVDWNQVEKTTFLSSSWDSSIKQYDPSHPSSIATFQGHTACVYNAIWNPRHPRSFVSCSGDGTVRMWDCQAPGPVQRIVAHDGEVLGVDWDKYDEWTVYSGGVDRAVKSWDLRRPATPLSVMQGHGFAIRRLKSSPHECGVVGSVSYDMTFTLWDTKLVPPMIAKFDFHTEFTTGLDFNLFIPGQVATCSWDRRVCLWAIS